MAEAGLALTVWTARLLVFALLVAAAWTDYRERRIPNAICVALLAAGLLWHAFTMDGDGLFASSLAGGLGLSASLLGGLAAFVGLFPLYLLRVLGAGDVKLATAIGAWIGWQALLPWALLVMIGGGVLALAWMVNTRRRTRVLFNLRLMATQTFVEGPRAAIAGFDPQAEAATDRLPYAWAILVGTAVFALAQYQGGWGLL
ncbi:MAG: A24 family peptidase [Pseudomonadota bacterium]|nr:A24 family peptidase [Pseudomonadota bacterium]